MCECLNRKGHHDQPASYNGPSDGSARCPTIDSNCFPVTQQPTNSLTHPILQTRILDLAHGKGQTLPPQHETDRPSPDPAEHSSRRQLIKIPANRDRGNVQLLRKINHVNRPHLVKPIKDDLMPQ